MVWPLCDDILFGARNRLPERPPRGGVRLLYGNASPSSLYENDESSIFAFAMGGKMGT